MSETLVEKANRLQAELDERDSAVMKALDSIADLCGCSDWEYAGQVVRDVQALVDSEKNLKEEVVELQHNIGLLNKKLRD